MRFFISAPERVELAAAWFPNGVVPPGLPLGTDPDVWADLDESVSTEVDALRTSYISPALHLNNYLEWAGSERVTGRVHEKPQPLSIRGPMLVRLPLRAASRRFSFLRSVSSLPSTARSEM